MHMTPKSACVPCQLRSQCLRHPERTQIRQVAYFRGRTEKGKNTFTEKMKRKVDSTVGRAMYSMRLAIAEPPFANICHAIGLDRFSLRGRDKVNTQWSLFCIVHNMKKLHRYGMQMAWNEQRYAREKAQNASLMSRLSLPGDRKSSRQVKNRKEPEKRKSTKAEKDFS